MKNLIIWMLIFSLSISFVFAVPPQTPAISGVGIDIRIPQGEFLRQSQDVTLRTHLFNKSSGFPMGNSSGVSCDIHLFNNTEGHILIEPMVFNSNEIDLELDIGGGNFTRLGFYSFILTCNTSDIGGFVSSSFTVTETGEAIPNTDTTSALSITLFILLITSTFFILAFKKEIFKTKYLNFIVKRCCMIVGLYLLVLNSAMMATIAGTSGLDLTSELFLYMEYFGWAGYIAILVVLFSSIIEMFKEYKMDIKEKQTGFRN